MPVDNTQIQQIALTDTEGNFVVNANIVFDRVNSVSALVNSIEIDVGDLSDLLTTDKSSIVAAINEVRDYYSSGSIFESYIGILSNLTTTNKSNVVAAINELDAEIGVLSSLATINKSTLVAAVNEIEDRVDDVGDITTLNTVDKSSTVAAINEHDSEIGVLSSLTTTTKTDLVSAVNEVDANVNQTRTQDLDMGSFKIINLADGVLSSDAVNKNQLDSKLPAASDAETLAGTINDKAVTPESLKYTAYNKAETEATAVVFAIALG